MRAILFDCDGTLADSFGIIVGTMLETFAAAGRPLPAEEAVRGVIGLSLETAIAGLLPASSAGEAAELTGLYRTIFQRRRDDPDMREALFPGIGALLTGLQARPDVRIGMVTGKSRRGVRILLERHRLEQMFAVVRTADDCPSKPHPAMVLECCGELGINPTAALVVGDSIHDMRMARAAGAAAIGVAWGSASPAALIESGASDVAADVESLRVSIGDWLDKAGEDARNAAA